MVTFNISYISYLIKYIFPHWFFETFSETLTKDDPDWQGWCLLQVIAAWRLSRPGKRVKLTLRSSSVSAAYIDRIYISQLAGYPPSVGVDLYDSAADLTALTSTQVVVPANTSKTLPAIYYNLDNTKHLLIAVDF